MLRNCRQNIIAPIHPGLALKKTFNNEQTIASNVSSIDQMICPEVNEWHLGQKACAFFIFVSDFQDYIMTMPGGFCQYNFNFISLWHVHVDIYHAYTLVYNITRKGERKLWNKTISSGLWRKLQKVNGYIDENIAIACR